ncbi:MAG: DUF29 domain-containing protein [Stellaceae bacterium]
MSGSDAQLYDQDFVRWTEQQAAALRQAAGLDVNLPLDWENLAEEIDSLGRSLKRELRSRVAVIIEHLIKLECSPATDPRRGWIDTIARERSETELLFDDSPSLRGEVGSVVAGEMERAARRLLQILRRHDEIGPDVISKVTAASYTIEQVLGDWFPGDAPLPDNRGEE